MRSIWAGSSALLLGLAMSVQAEDVDWRPAATLQPPTAAAPASPPLAALGRPLPASLGRPMPDPQVVPVAFSPSGNGLLSTLVSARSMDTPQPMPQGQPLKGPPLIEVPEPGPPSKLQSVPLDPFAPPGDAPFGGDAWCGGGSGLCGGDPCCPDGPCCPGFGPSHLFWVRGEYLLWKISPHHLPPLVTTSPPGTLGVLPNANVLFGGSVNQDDLSGARFTFGVWLDPCETYGLEGSFFFLGPRTVGFSASSPGIPVLARPFFDVNPMFPPSETAEQIANPAMPPILPLAGSVNVSLFSELAGFEINGIKNLCRSCCGRVDVIGGFRYLRLRDILKIDENLVVPATPDTMAMGIAGQTTTVNDTFATRDQFYGGQLGLRWEWHWRRWQLDLTGKVALGDTHEQVDINGSTLITPGPMAMAFPQAFPGGLLAQPTNIGHHNRDRFAVVPEMGINVGYQITDRWRAFAGYNFIYWSNVARPGEQIDRTINSSQIGGRPLVGVARPILAIKDTDLWAYGVNFGLEFRY
jgi:hypothetical protein